MAFGINIGKTNPTKPGVSHSENQSTGGSSTSSNSQSTSWRDAGSIWGPQAQGLQGLYNMAGGMFGGGAAGGGLPAGAGGFGGGGVGAGQGGFGGFGGNPNGGQAGIAQGQAQSLYDKSIAGFDRLMNPGVNPQLAAYSGDVQRNLERNLLPAIQSNAGMTGQGGGTRQGVAQGLALSDSNQQITDMASNLYNADMNRMGQAMSMAPQLGAFGQQIPWYAMNQYSGILGKPTQLQGAAGSQSTGSSSGGSWEQSSGFTDATGQSGGGGWQFGIGKGAS